ncbi:MAG: hypothetical protein KAJ98_11705 [Spirochaetaceae bacterium]|nr:hypothetical protein [Spirochaetaceae bacterium]
MIPFIALLLLAGCDEFGLLGNGISDTMIRMAGDEGFLNPGEEIDLWVESEDNPPDLISARLESESGSIWKVKVEPPSTGWDNSYGEVGGLLIPDTIPEGSYVLVTEAWLGEKLLTEEHRDLYVLNGEWAIRGLELFPPQAVSGGMFFIRVLMELPEGTDPWLRWIQDDKPMAEGFSSAGWNEVILNAGNSPGVRSLTVELHLDEPSAEERPVRSFSTDLYTVESLPPGRDNLGPPESYPILMHFDGTLKNDSAPGLDTEPIILGKPRPVFTGDGMGFRFSDGDGLIWNGVRLPYGSDGEWKPFSLTFGIKPEEEKTGQILKIEDDEEFSIVLTVSEGKGLTLMMNGEETYLSFFPLPETGDDPVSITVLFLPVKNGLDFVWLADGDTVTSGHWGSTLKFHGESVRVSLGGEDGFTGLLTEFGYKDRDVEADRFTFYRNVDGGMRISEGFEDEDIHQEIEFSFGAVVDNGSLILPPSSVVRFPAGGGGQLAFRKITGDESAELTVADPISGKISGAVIINDEISGDSPYRIIIPLEKTWAMSDNETRAFYELRVSGRNISNLRLEHILVNRE